MSKSKADDCYVVWRLKINYIYFIGFSNVISKVKLDILEFIYKKKKKEKS